MITVNLYYSGQNGAARRFAEEMLSSGTAAAIRKEKGNLRYEYFYPLEDEETVLLIDSWETQEALDRHHKSELMQKILALREKYRLSVRAERFVSEEMPEADAGFLKK